MMSRHPVGSRPWFVRVKRGCGCNLRPNTRAGWLITGLYVLAMTGLSLLLLSGDAEPATSMIVGWAVVATAMTVAFLAIAWRTSETLSSAAGACPARAGASRAKTIGIAIAAAGIILAAAWFEVKV
ncbi:MAG TPA: hypothetical protein VFO69_09190 [Allosphingosinicella sp.]|nr:hypothetical protein [Allosphingosinicella sp.]